VDGLYQLIVQAMEIIFSISLRSGGGTGTKAACFIRGLRMPLVL
jgi:hypothetical protein